MAKVSFPSVKQVGGTGNPSNVRPSGGSGVLGRLQEALDAALFHLAVCPLFLQKVPLSCGKPSQISQNCRQWWSACGNILPFLGFASLSENAQAPPAGLWCMNTSTLLVPQQPRAWTPSSDDDGACPLARLWGHEMNLPLLLLRSSELSSPPS